MKIIKDKSEIKTNWRTRKEISVFFAKSKQAIDKWGLPVVAKFGQIEYHTLEDVEKKLVKKSKYTPPTIALPDGSVVDYSVELALKTKQERIRLELANELTKQTQLPVSVLEDCFDRVAIQQAAIFDSLTLNIKRKVPEIKSSVLSLIKKEVIKLQNSLADLQIKWD